MSGRAVAGLWLVVGILAWNVIFDIYVSRGTRDYLSLVAESELAMTEAPPLPETMRWWKREGAMAASGLALLIFGAGCATGYWRRRV